ncbi:MAG: [acyl-carrier-protein] S-malonyltransferase [Myxococcota bacterium]|jgi:[acyl-carrier-protein] S-malonyltransferase
MSARRTLLVCPGRGSYGRDALGQLAGRSSAASAVIAKCDAWRGAAGSPTVSELDAADRFSPRLHVAGEHASLLTFACSLADLADLDRERFEVVGVTGNSMGWYTALAAAGALTLDDAIRLVDTMGAYQERNVIGGQILTPLVDATWAVDPAAEAAIERSIASGRQAGHTIEWSIRLGGFAVLGADVGGAKHLLATLPSDVRGPRTFPVQLPLHSAFHTSLMRGASERAWAELRLDFRAPDVPLFDGRGHTYAPRWANPGELAEYTLGAQVTETYDFSRAVIAGLHHTGADAIVVLGPGNSLGAPIAQTLVADHWGGVADKAGFSARQADRATLLSFGVPHQRATLV